MTLHPDPEPRHFTRILALDVGNKRIGIALSDPLGYTAQPLLTLHRATLKADLKSIARLIRRHEVATVLIGLPLHASGEASPQSTKTEAFAEALRLHLQQQPDPPPAILFLDERHTTTQAHALLDHSTPRRSAAGRHERTGIIDQVAATLILQAHLDRQSPPLLPDPDA